MTRLQELLAAWQEAARLPYQSRYNAGFADGQEACANEIALLLPSLLAAVERVERVEAVVTQLEQTFAQYDAGTPKGVAILGMADAMLRGIREALAGTDGGEVQPVVIRVRQRSNDWHAQIGDDPKRWGAGRSPDEAIGDVLRSHPECGVRVVFATDGGEVRDAE